MDCGYDVPFSSEVDSRLQCPICLLILKKPVQTACGHRFCNSCIKKVIPHKNTVLTCPVDKTYTRVNLMFPDLATEREVMSLQTKCVNVVESCTWHGELRELENHRAVCDKEQVRCPNGCPTKIKRLDIESHSAICSHRHVQCPYCQKRAKQYQMEGHNEKCPKLPVLCSLCKGALLPKDEIEKHQSPDGQCVKTIIKCPYSFIGCKFQIERHLMKDHLQAPNALQEHMDLTLKWMINQGTVVKELSQKVCKIHETNQSILPQLLQNDKKHGMETMELKNRNMSGKLHWKVKLIDYIRHVAYVSPAFYTGCPGYRVQLSLNLEGPKEGNTRFTSLALTLLTGDYDNQVIFPFNATCIVTLYDQKKCPPQEKGHINCQMVIREIPRNFTASATHVPHIYKREICQYVRLPDLIGANSRFVKSNCLHFEVTVLHSYCPPPEGAQHIHNCNCPALMPTGSEATTKQNITSRSVSIQAGEEPANKLDVASSNAE